MINIVKDLLFKELCTRKTVCCQQLRYSSPKHKCEYRY